MNKILVLACLAAAGVSSSRAADEATSEAPELSLDPGVQAYLDKYCLECHDDLSEEGDFRIDNLSPRVGFENTPQWLEIMERISSGEMPPEEEKTQPDSEESAGVVEWLAARMKEGESFRLAQRGRVSWNRLSREEYVNTMRDLLGVQYDASDPGAFLEDPEWHGFERIGSVMTLSPSNIEKYLTAAETVLAEAYPEKEPEFLEYTKPVLEEKQIREHHRERLGALGLLDKVRFEVWPGDIYRYSANESLPAPGIYEITYRVSGLKPPKGRAPRLHVYETKLDRVLYDEEIVAPEEEPIEVTFQAHLPAGRPAIHVINEVPGPSTLPRSGRHGNRPFISTKDGRLPWQMKLTDEQGDAIYPFLILDSISWRGPLISDRERQLRDSFFPTEEGGETELRERLTTLARRAFRRPVSDEEMNAFLAIVKAEREAGEDFRESVKAGMLAILCSKSFLFLTEGDEEADRFVLDDWEIASRLSYLLWSTMPDDDLFAAAEAGKLKDRAELSRQVSRMLADPRARRFSDAFSTQWLRLKKVGMFAPDKELYPDYDAHLEQSMIAETRAFFHQVLEDNRPLGEFLDSDWTMMNRRLAEFYGVPAPEKMGDEFQRVALPTDGQRGGVLTQAAILSLSSDGTRHRPVHRGVWVLESILGKSPPPPPANVDPIAPTPEDSPKATLRMKLEAHIKDPNCASCHAKIDPLGLAFDNYDAIGRWRTEETVEGTGANPPVNPAGELADGRAFATPEDFKQLLLGDIDTFAETFIEKLATYGTRRTMTFDDQNDLDSIAEAAKGKDYRLRDVIEAFVLSDLFQKR